MQSDCHGDLKSFSPGFTTTQRQQKCQFGSIFCLCAGSATQIAALVMPGSVLLAWVMGQPLDLNFNSFETATLFITVLLTIVLVMVSHLAPLNSGSLVGG